MRFILSQNHLPRQLNITTTEYCCVFQELSSSTSYSIMLKGLRQDGTTHGFPTPLGNLPNAVGEPSQRRWGYLPRALGYLPKGVGIPPQGRWDTSPRALGYLPKGVGIPPQGRWGTMILT